MSAGFARGFMGLFGLAGDERYLVPAPLYHAAPLAWSTNLMRNGSSVVIMPRFDPELALQTIQDQRVTASQWVPTHFRRLLQLPESVREKYDLSSLRFAVHAAAPCPIPVKRQMIEWWGPIIHEYYGATEGLGYLIAFASASLSRGQVFAGVAVIALFGFVLDLALGAVRRRLVFWEQESVSIG